MSVFLGAITSIMRGTTLDKIYPLKFEKHCTQSLNSVAEEVGASQISWKLVKMQILTP